MSKTLQQNDEKVVESRIETNSKMRKALFIIGGTGIGKTRLGIHLAKKLNGEVINSDAMQLYRGLPIATAQPTMEERQGVVHHLLGILDVHESWTVRDYRDEALKVMEDVWSRGKIPIVVGGTLYYVQSLIWRSLLDERPGFEQEEEEEDEEKPQQQDQKKFKKEEEDISQIVEDERPYDKLKRLDPARAAQLHPNDERKIARSLEILKETGKSLIQAKEDPLDVRLDCKILWLTCNDQNELERRLKTRVEAMIDAGMVKEAELFLKQAEEKVLSFHQKGVYQAIGFRELIPLIEDPTPSSEQKRQKCVESLVIKHRQYVKSQLKWIRNRILPRTVPVHQLDASNLNEWETQVAFPAEEISRMFFVSSTSGGEEISNNRFPLSNLKETKSRDTKTAKTCEVCNDRVLVGEEQWQKHVNGRSHRKNVERKKKMERKQMELLLLKQNKDEKEEDALQQNESIRKAKEAILDGIFSSVNNTNTPN